MNLEILRSRRRRIFTQIAAFAAALALWEIVPASGLVKSIFFPPFSSVIFDFFHLLINGTILFEGLLTLTRTITAVLIGLVAGTLVGLAMESNNGIKWLLNPIIALGYPTPKVALIPIFVLWFGIGDLSKILLATLAAFFPIVVATFAAAEGVRVSVRWSARALGAGPIRMFFEVMLPATIPGILTGLQIAVPFSMIVVVVSEMTSSGGGLGNVLTVASRNFQVATQFSVLFSLMIMGIVLERGLVVLRRRGLAWE
jgi:NitT/TauT family transport system permease protein